MKGERTQIPRLHSSRIVKRVALSSGPALRYRQCRSGGQAIIEFVVGLVGVLVVTAILLQVGRLGRERMHAMYEARARAGQDAMSDEMVEALPGPEYILNWEPGNDERRYSADDEPLSGPDRLGADLASYAKPNDLETWAPDNELSDMATAHVPLEEYEIVHGHKKTDDLALFPIVRHLIYNADSIQMEADVWLVWARGIQE